MENDDYMDRNHPVLVNKIIDLMKLTNNYMRYAPSHERHALCKKIRIKTLEVSELVIEAYMRKPKTTTLFKLDVTHEQLKMLWRLFWELGYFQRAKGEMTEQQIKKISYRKYSNVSKKLDEIGNMIGGWIKYDKEANISKCSKKELV